MKYFIILMLLLFVNTSHAQEHYLIQETDSIDIYETYLSNTSKNNLFPYFYKDGLIYVTNFNTKYHNLYYSNLNSEPTKIQLKNKFRFGASAIYGSTIYFTGESKFYKTTIYKGVIENNKVSKINNLEICDPKVNYSDPFISEDGQQLILISDEKNVFHIKEFIRNDDGKWEIKSIPYISHPDFDIINPTLFNQNTIYFSANIYNGPVKKISYTKDEKGKIIIKNVEREEGVFNIYKIERKNGIWGLPKKVNALSSDSDDLGVLFDSDNSGFLTTFRYNSNDNIYYFILK